MKYSYYEVFKKTVTKLSKQFVWECAFVLLVIAMSLAIDISYSGVRFFLLLDNVRKIIMLLSVIFFVSILVNIMIVTHKYYHFTMPSIMYLMGIILLSVLLSSLGVKLPFVYWFILCAGYLLTKWSWVIFEALLERYFHARKEKGYFRNRQRNG